MYPIANEWECISGVIGSVTFSTIYVPAFEYRLEKSRDMKQRLGRRRWWEFRGILEFGDSDENGCERYGKLMGKEGDKGREMVRKEFENIVVG